MKFGKSTTIALLVGAIAFPVSGMDLTKEKKTTSITEHEREEKHILNMGLVELAGHFADAQNEEYIHTFADALLNLLTIHEDRIQAELAANRSGEQEAFSERAYAKGYDYTRLYKYQEGYDQNNLISPHRALGKHANSPLNTMIRESEKELGQIHSLMSELERIREMKLNLLNETNSPHSKMLQAALSYFMGEAKKFEFTSRTIKTNRGALPEAGFFNSTDMGLCPDKFVVGKKVATLFPYFSMEGWKQSAASVGMRTGHPKEPIAQIRLQGKLWDVFAGKKGPVVPSNVHWNPAQHAFFVDSSQMTILPRTNLKSKICEYKFTAPEGHGQWGQVAGYYPFNGGWAMIPTKATYSIVLVPTGEQYPEPRDKSYDAVQDQLQQEIEGEGFKVPDVNITQESRDAVHEEMRQRLARRNSEENQMRRLHRQGIPIDQGSETHLMPSDIKDQTYGRVHVPDYRYGRTYERIYDIEQAQPATRQQVEEARARMFKSEAYNLHTPSGSVGKWGRNKNSKEEMNLDYSNKAERGIANSKGYSQYYQEKGLKEREEDLTPNKQFNKAVNEQGQ